MRTYVIGDAVGGGVPRMVGNKCLWTRSYREHTVFTVIVGEMAQKIIFYIRARIHA
jgi:hypothetical protein